MIAAPKTRVGDLFNAGMGVPELQGSQTIRVNGKHRNYATFDGSEWKNGKIQYNLNHEMMGKPEKKGGIGMVDKSKLMQYATNSYENRSFNDTNA